MKLIAKFTYVMLVCILIVGSFPLSAFAEGEFSLPAPGPECFEYRLNEDSTAVITKYSGNSSFVAIPVYLVLLLLFAGVTTALGTNGDVIVTLKLFQLRMAALFCTVIAFAAVWVAIALLYRVWRTVKEWF